MKMFIIKLILLGICMYSIGYGVEAEKVGFDRLSTCLIVLGCVAGFIGTFLKSKPHIQPKEKISHSCVPCLYLGGECCGTLYWSDDGRILCNECGREFELNLRVGT